MKKDQVTGHGHLMRLVAMVIIGVAVLGCSPHGCGGSAKGSMTMQSLHALQDFAQSKLPVGGVAASWPIPVREHGVVRAAFFVYPCSHDPKVVWEGAPERLIVLDAETADVVRDTPESPSNLGPPPPAHGPLLGSHERRVASMDELLALRKRISDLAPGVWGAFGEGRTALTPQARAEVAEYVRIMDKIEPEALMPYYRHIGREFYAWTSQVQPGAPR